VRDIAAELNLCCCSCAVERRVSNVARSWARVSRSDEPKSALMTQGGSRAASFAVMHNGSPNNVLG
jgi:hypothetical protein